MVDPAEIEGLLGADPGAQTGAQLCCLLPAVFLEQEKGSERGERKTQQQETINLAYLLMKLQAKSCDVLSGRCGEAQLVWIRQGSLQIAVMITAVFRAS